VNTRISGNGQVEIGGRNGNRASPPEITELGERTTGARVHEARHQSLAKPKNAAFRYKKLIAGGLIGGVVLTGALVYWLHARNFQSTDDAYTTTHGAIEPVAIDWFVTKLNPSDYEIIKQRSAKKGSPSKKKQKAAAIS
jgi:hypothetical protein